MVCCTLLATTAIAIDANGNGLNDIWETIYGASALAPNADTDGDGWTNLQESAAGTNPFDPLSHPVLHIAPWSVGQVQLGYTRLPGKRYRIESKTSLSLSTWTPEWTDIAPNGDPAAYFFAAPAGAKFWRIAIDDVDSDGDGLNNAEEWWLGFDPATDHTGRNEETDLARVTAGLSATSIVTLGVLDSRMSERWPKPGVVVVRRSGGLKPITVNVAFTGTATRGTDYTPDIAGTTVFIPGGVAEVPVLLNPIADSNDAEVTETITVTLQSGSGYVLGSGTSGTVNLENETATSAPSVKAAARLLIQAAFGPDQALAGQEVPQNLQPVMSMGFSGWIDDQFTRPVTTLQPWTEWEVANGNALGLYGNPKEHAWWARAMGAPKLRPDATTTVLPDPLRQRVAFALSEILVVSDRPEQIASEQAGMANYYDLFETYAFGNYRDLLQAVARHPAMGIYLSHLGNQKANPALNVFPDENFAREIMQLFTIGLWKLNPDGTKQLDGLGQPIPTYNNGDITELARVFTGLSFKNPDHFFASYPRNFIAPMDGWDAYHDCNAKTLLGGLQLPARTPSASDTGTATMADVTAAVDNLFNHQNVGPFLALRLIQRFVTSNPSPAYIGRVAAAFANTRRCT